MTQLGELPSEIKSDNGWRMWLFKELVLVPALKECADESLTHGTEEKTADGEQVICFPIYCGIPKGGYLLVTNLVIRAEPLSIGEWPPEAERSGPIAGGRYRDDLDLRYLLTRVRDVKTFIINTVIERRYRLIFA